MAFLQLVTIVVRDYDEAIGFYCDALGFDLVEDSPSLTNDGAPKRWVVVRPPGAETGILLAQPSRGDQAEVIGRQTADRVAFFLEVDDFEAAFDRLLDHRVEIVRPPFAQPYGTVAVFRDIGGNRWDLIGRSAG